MIERLRNFAFAAMGVACVAILVGCGARSTDVNLVAPGGTAPGATPTSFPAVASSPPAVPAGTDPTCTKKGMPFVQGYGSITGVNWSGSMTVDQLVNWKNTRQPAQGATPGNAADAKATQRVLGLPANGIVVACIFSGSFENLNPPGPPQPPQTEIGVLVLPDGSVRLDYSRASSTQAVAVPKL